MTRAAVAVLALLGWVLGSVGVDHHVAVETHTRCEHGAEVHVERVGEAVPVSPSSGPVLADPTWWEHDGDHHCTATASIVAAEPEFSATPTVLPTADRPELIPTIRVAAVAALFRLAPKTSPPIALV